VHLVRTQVAGEPLRVGQPDLADEHPRIRVALSDSAPSAVYVVQLVAVLVWMLVRRVLGDDVRECGILQQQRSRIDPDARGAAIEPEPQDVGCSRRTSE